jgi:cyclohexa-1,5-dienecarbonyl-CoA hydratase
MPVSVSVSGDLSRAAFRVSHPKGNIITAEIVGALRSAFDSLDGNHHLKLVTIEGEGADFSFGASIPEHAPGEIGRVLPEMHALIDRILETQAVTGAIVRGRCLGGGFELALACDVIFAADTAVFGLPEIQLGVFPPAASVLLPLRVGYARGTSAILTGDAKTAGAWADAGLIELVASLPDLERRVDEWFARHLQPRSAAGLRHAVVAARAGLLAQVRATLPALERLYLEDLMRTEDAAEGVEAFMQKRTPKWQDR